MGIPIRNKKHYGLIGMPLGHSVSPFIHSELQKLAGIVGDYRLFEIEEKLLANRFENELKGLDGFNVTIPYKTKIIPFLDKLSPRAELFGAVNTVDVKSGKLHGYNTDCIGFTRAIGAEGIDLKGKILILGCGGVSRMFAYESAIAGADITLAVRDKSLEKAKILENEIKSKLNYKINTQTLSNIYSGYDLIINGTPVGMYPNSDGCPVSKEVIKKSKAVFDAVYNPVETKLICLAKKNGLKFVGGLPMLVWQAVVAEEIWNDAEFSSEDIKSVIKRTERYLRNE